MGLILTADLSEVDAFADQLAAQLGVEAWGEEVHQAIVWWWAGIQGQIPQLSGALKRSLIRRNDDAHFWRAEGDEVSIGSHLPQALFQQHNIPRPTAEVVAAALIMALALTMARMPRRSA